MTQSITSAYWYFDTGVMGCFVAAVILCSGALDCVRLGLFCAVGGEGRLAMDSGKAKGVCGYCGKSVSVAN